MGPNRAATRETEGRRPGPYLIAAAGCQREERQAPEPRGFPVGRAGRPKRVFSNSLLVNEM